jgi:hypothetical protein
MVDISTTVNGGHPTILPMVVKGMPSSITSAHGGVPKVVQAVCDAQAFAVSRCTPGAWLFFLSAA